MKLIFLLILSFSAFGFSVDREIKTPNDLILDPGGESRSTKNFVMETSQVIRFNDSGSNFVSIAGPAIVPSSYVLLLPDTDGVAEQILFTDGAGVLEWRDIFLASTDNKLLKSDTVGTAEVQESGITISDTDQMSGALIDSDTNTITNIVNADIKSTAAIARTKIASATANYVLVNNGSGVMSEEQYLAKTKGGTGITSTATFPASGVVVTEAGVQVVTLKDYDVGTQTNTSRITLGRDTTVNLDLLTDKEGTIAYDDTLNKIVFNDGLNWTPLEIGGISAKVVVEAYRTTSVQTIATVTTATVIFNAETTDTDAAFNTTTGVFTAPRDGYFSVASYLYVVATTTAPTTNSRNMYLYINGGAGTRIGYSRVSTADISGAFTQSIAKQGIFLNLNDTLEVQLNNATDESLDVAIGREFSYFSITEI